MAHKIVALFVALVVFVGGLLAADGVVVKYADDKLIVKVDGKEQTITFKNGRPHVHDSDDKELRPAQYADFLKEGVKVEIEEKDGKILEVKIKK